MFFGYASSFVFIGMVAFNFLITSDVIKQVHGVPSHRHWYYFRAHAHADAQITRQPLLDSDDRNAAQNGVSGWCAQSVLAFRLTWQLQVGIIVLWVSLLSVQALFGLDKTLQEPLMFVNLFGLMTGMQLNVLFSKTLDVIASPAVLLGAVCTIMPTYATVYAMQTFGIVELLKSDAVRVGATACFYILGEPQLSYPWASIN